MKRQAVAIWLSLTANRKKVAVLGVMLLVLAGVGIRNLIVGGPRTSSASIKSAPDVESVKLGAQGREAVSRTRAALQTQAGPAIEIIRSPQLVRNLFAVDPAHFPDLVQTDPPEAPADSQIVQPPKSTDEPSDVRPPDTKQRVLEESQRLRLASTMVGQNSMAVIEVREKSGTRRTVVRVSQEIEGFIVREIGSQTVVIEKEGVSVTLKRALPEG